MDASLALSAQDTLLLLFDSLLLLFDDVSPDPLVVDQICVFAELDLKLLSLNALMSVHSLLLHTQLSGVLDFAHTLHGVHSLDHKVTVVPDGHIAALLELEDWVVDELLVVSGSVRLGPPELSGILLRLEEFVALRGAEAEQLRVIAAEGDTVTGVDAL